jgi:serine phosphatase RsbU (regulator of sigma subunit)
MERDALNDHPLSPGMRIRRGAGVHGPSSKGLWKPRRLIAIIALIGLILTAAVSWTAWRIDRGNEHRLLQVQTKQAAEVVSSAIVGIDGPLQTALDIAVSTGGDPSEFTRFMGPYAGSGGLFVSAALWQTSGPAPAPIASVGEAPGLAPSSAPAEALIAKAARSTSFVVTSVSTTGLQRIGYALANRKDATYAVYAERTIPANRRVSVESNSAFADLHYATYLGPTTSLAALQTTDQPPAHLPLSGNTDREAIPFGDTVITLVTSPRGHLGGSLVGQLPWILLIGGILLSGASAFIAWQLVRRRTHAENDAQIITELYDRLDGLYGEQRTISETLQHALLPHSNPSIPDLEIASRYVAGAQGVDIGGDWYSIIRLDETHFGFVVGDVSGRGVEAAAIMARIRFTLRAYLFEGHPPNIALELCSRQLDITTDGHMATVLVGLGDLVSGRVVLSNAGHPEPLILSGSGTRFVRTTVGPPLGVAVTSYASTTVQLTPGSMLMAFTDGLIERRHEDLDVGLQRLAAAAASADGTVDDVLTAVLSAMTRDASEDDIAILAFRWANPEEAGPAGQPLVVAATAGLRPSSEPT